MTAQHKAWLRTPLHKAAPAGACRAQPPKAALSAELCVIHLTGSVTHCPSVHTDLAAAAVVVVVVAAVAAVVAAAVAEQQNQNDDPPPVVAAEAVAQIVVVTHNDSLRNFT